MRTSVRNFFSPAPVDAAKNSDHARAVDRTGIADRLELVMKRTGWSAREWAKQAELREGNHVNQIIRRLRSDPKAGLSIEVIAKLCRAADVSLDWIVTGDAPVIRPDDRYPSRAFAVFLARVMGLPGLAIESIAEVDDLPVDPGIPYWLNAIEAALPAPKQLPAPERQPRGRKRKR